MKGRGFKSNVTITLVAVLFLIVLSAVYVNFVLQSIADDLVEEAKPDQHLVDLKGLMFDLSNAESNVKSYSLTGDEAYLFEYNTAIVAVEKGMQSLYGSHEKGSFYAGRIERIDTLIQRKFKILDELMIIENQQRLDQVIEKVQNKVDDLSLIGEIDSDLASENSTGTKEEKQNNFFQRVFGNRENKRKNPKLEDEDPTLFDDVDLDKDYDQRYVEVERELLLLKMEQRAAQTRFKRQELKLIQNNKRIDDELTIIFYDLEQIEQENMVAQIEKTEKNGEFTGFVIAIFCILSCAFLIIAGYVIYVYYIKNERYKSDLSEAHHKSELNNKNLLDSINYAKRLQTANLPEKSKIRKTLPNCFVMYQPKDIVAGDFYWVEQKEDQTFIAVADCTGHGVPGAMVSMACSSALNRCVKEFNLSKPASILDKARDLVIETFDQNDFMVYDGMDIALCRIDHKKNKIQYAGAHNALYIVNDNKLKEIKADKQPVARFEMAAPFKNHEHTLRKGDTFFIFTDGYADQFGGPKGKKYMYGRFKELLSQNGHLPIADQKELLEEEFVKWKGRREQIDDVCVVGFRLEMD